MDDLTYYRVGSREWRNPVSRRVLYVIAVVLVVIVTFVGVAWAEDLGTATLTTEQAAPPTTAQVNMGPTPDVAAAEAAIAQQQVDEYLATLHAEEVRKQQAAAAAAARASAGTAANYDPGDGSRWDQLAMCECGGNWACNTGNGFGGGLQFMHQRSYSTWLSFGGGEFAPHPWEASREQQIVVAERVLASSGWGAWPGCTRKFGWR